MKKLFLSLLAVVAVVLSAEGADLRKDAQKSIDELKALIKKGKKSKVSTLKEEITVRTAELFMGYADWDEKNYEENLKMFKTNYKYKKEPEKYAKILHIHEREQIIEMVADAKAELEKVLSGEHTRLYSPEIDWKKPEIKGDIIEYNGKPVFLTDWVWKDRTPATTEFHGDKDGLFVNLSILSNEKGDISSSMIDKIKAKGSGTFGDIFINHKGMPKWARDKYPEVMTGGGLEYVQYDINNPKTREFWSATFKGIVPLIKGKNFGKMGYMLCNEPHWNLVKGWTASPISALAKEDFRKWVASKHKTIAEVNRIWGKNYATFSDVEAPELMDINLLGTPFYFDYMSWNMDRVTDWFLFLRDEIQKHDPDAKTHIKVMPSYFTGNSRNSGIDMEAFAYNSEILGNDAHANVKKDWGKAQRWEENYCFNWYELVLSYDFFKSVSPDKIITNSEGHLFSSYVNWRIPKEYIRCTYWLAHIHGLTFMQTWYWPRKADGSVAKNIYNGTYVGSCNHQPSVINEVHTTTADLNSVSETIMAFQRQRKSIRVFYTKASAINKDNHMDHTFDCYESMLFDGSPMGFVTEGILNRQKSSLWDVVVLYKTPFVYNADVVALQKYLDNGGTIVMDSESVKTDEYGNPLKVQLKESKGKIINVSSLEQIRKESHRVVVEKSNAPLLKVEENNGLAQKGAIWRAVKGKKGAIYLTISNLSKNSTKIKVTYPNGKSVKSVKDGLNGVVYSSELDMKPMDTYFLEVK